MEMYAIPIPIEILEVPPSTKGFRLPLMPSNILSIQVKEIDVELDYVDLPFKGKPSLFWIPGQSGKLVLLVPPSVGNAQD